MYLTIIKTSTSEMWMFLGYLKIANANYFQKPIYIIFTEGFFIQILLKFKQVLFLTKLLQYPLQNKGFLFQQILQFYP